MCRRSIGRQEAMFAGVVNPTTRSSLRKSKANASTAPATPVAMPRLCHREDSRQLISTAVGEERLDGSVHHAA
jgi:hypothetical protein